MSLNDLKFTDSKRPVPAFRASPAEKARNAVLANIEVQRLLLNVERGEPINLTKTVKKEVDGAIVDVMVARHPRKWFWKNPSGQYLVEMLFGGHAVSINGKSTIQAGTIDDVEKVLNILAEATSKGDLDSQIAVAASKRKFGRKKVA